MSTPEERLKELGLELPKPTAIPEGLHLPFSFVNVRGDRALFSGHPKNAPDGSIGGPFGVVGKDLTTARAYEEALARFSSEGETYSTNILNAQQSLGCN